MSFERVCVCWKEDGNGEGRKKEKELTTYFLVLIIRKYQFMEANNKRRIGGLKDKIPDIQKTLETVRFLQKRDVSVIVVVCGASDI